VLRPSPIDRELELAAVHPGIDVSEVVAETGWDLRIRDRLEITSPPTEIELQTLRGLRGEPEGLAE
jgi:glutaconate CoA-transferase subunit B